MSKINQEEYEILKRLDDKWKWIARDNYRDEKEYENVLGGIRVFVKKPFKRPRDDHFGVDGTGMGIDWIYLDRDMFFFIKPYNDKPYNIDELIREYEIKELRLAPSGTVIVDSFDESEEICVKDKQWLIKRVENYIPINDKTVGRVVDNILDIIHQLDEPEVLSHEWIDRNKFEVNGWNEAVHVEDLENLIVPKQELPVIPNYVSEYLEIAKSDVTLMRVLEIANRRDELPKWEKEYDWISANDETFARAWLYGYEVEKEKLYYIKFSVNKYVQSFDANQLTSFKVFAGRFTEEQIKKVNPKLMALAVEVEE